MYAASGPARNATAAATSSTVPKRGRQSRSISGAILSWASATRSVSMGPACTTLAVTRRGPRSRARPPGVAVDGGLGRSVVGYPGHPGAGAHVGADQDDPAVVGDPSGGGPDGGHQPCPGHRPEPVEQRLVTVGVVDPAERVDRGV